MSGAVEKVLNDVDAGATAETDNKAAIRAIEAIERQNERTAGLFDRFLDLLKGKGKVPHLEPDGDEHGSNQGDGDGDEGTKLKGWMCKGCSHKMSMGKKHPFFNMKKEDERFEPATKGHRCTKCGEETMPVMGKGDDADEDDVGGDSDPRQMTFSDIQKGEADQVADDLVKGALGMIKDFEGYADAQTSAIQAMHKGIEALAERLEASMSAYEVLAKGIDDMRHETEAKLEEMSKGIGERLAEFVNIKQTDQRREPTPFDKTLQRRGESSVVSDLSKGQGNSEDMLTDDEIQRLKIKGVLDYVTEMEYRASGRAGGVYRVNGMDTKTLRAQLARH